VCRSIWFVSEAGRGKNATSVAVARNLTHGVDQTKEPAIMEGPIEPSTQAPRQEFSVMSQLAATAAEVWSHAATMQGVNRELFPIARMTYPKAFSRLDHAPIVPGQPLFRAWILLFGLIPIDYDDITLAALDPEGGFLEISRMFSQSNWRHERRVRAIPGGCTIADHVQFTPRLTAIGPVYRVLFQLCFKLRHYNLRKLFGQLPESGSQTPAE
jgi:ligand-binding SRPBCC domain-containing protein